MTPPIKKLGLIAGNGHFPFLFARAARDQGIAVVGAAIFGDTSFLLRFFVPQLRWFRVGQLAELFRYFRGKELKRLSWPGR